MANNPFITDDGDAKKYFISEDEVNSASSNIDLLASHSTDRDVEAVTSTSASNHSLESTSGNTIMNELEMTTSTLVSNATVDPRNIRNNSAGSHYSHDDYHSGDEADDESDYGIHLDDEIVNNVLGSSDARIKKTRSDATKKYFFYGILVFCSFVLLVSLLDPDFVMRNYIAAEGSAYHYHDRGDFSHGSKENAIEETLQFDESDYRRAEVFNNAVDVKGPDPFAPERGELPFYWSLRNACPTVEDILSECLDLAVAGEKVVPPSAAKNFLELYEYGDTKRKYANVNLGNDDEFERAKNQNLAKAGIVNLISSHKLHKTLDQLFKEPDTQARAFTVVRHPVDLAIATYYNFVHTTVEEALSKMSLDEFIESNYYVKNENTIVLWHGWGKEEPEVKHLMLAKEILRSKFIVGRHDDLDGSIALFEDYFFWDAKSSSASKCKKKHKALAVEKELDIFFEVGPVKKGSEIYNKIVQMNALDMELYWFAIDLHKAQRAWIPPHVPMEEITIAEEEDFTPVEEDLTPVEEENAPSEE